MNTEEEKIREIGKDMCKDCKAVTHDETYMTGFFDGYNEAFRWREIAKEPIPDNCKRVLAAHELSMEYPSVMSAGAAELNCHYWRPINKENVI